MELMIGLKYIAVALLIGFGELQLHRLVVAIRTSYRKVRTP